MYVKSPRPTESWINSIAGSYRTVIEYEIRNQYDVQMFMLSN